MSGKFRSVFEIFPPPPPPPGRILRNFTRDTDTFVACQLNFPEKLISISRKVGSSTIRPIFGKIIRSDRNRVEIKHLSNIAINRVFRGGEYRHPRASGANTCPDLCIIPKESIPKMPIKVVKGGGKKSKRRIFCLTKQVFSIFERDLFNETGGQSPEVVARFFFFSVERIPRSPITRLITIALSYIGDG